mmetsp:Transcript_1356/g.5554  ORF Transcript_1356/g.5554 Transcript_1356/m.5554 type:complete len:201 (+) Transcript_1356:46-648(+)
MDSFRATERLSCSLTARSYRVPMEKSLVRSSPSDRRFDFDTLRERKRVKSWRPPSGSFSSASTTRPPFRVTSTRSMHTMTDQTSFAGVSCRTTTSDKCSIAARRRAITDCASSRASFGMIFISSAGVILFGFLPTLAVDLANGRRCRIETADAAASASRKSLSRLVRFGNHCTTRAYTPTFAYSSSSVAFESMLELISSR